MNEVEWSDGLRAEGSLVWSDEERGWVGDAQQVMGALTRLGYQEYKREVAWTRRDRRPSGGVWQGLNPSTGSVASVVWRARPDMTGAVAVVEIDGMTVQDAMTNQLVQTG